MAYREAAADKYESFLAKHRDEAFANEVRVWASAGVTTGLGAVSALAFGSDPWRVLGGVAAAWSVMIGVRTANALVCGGW